MSMDLYQARVQAPEEGGPLIFAFHGTGGDEHQFFALTQQLMPGAGIISPRGDVSEMGAVRFFRRTGEGVYDMKDLARATEKMANFVSAYRAAHPDSPAYAFGYSNGANILASVFMQEPGLFDRVAMLHPMVTWEPDADPSLRDRPVLITAGRHDPITPWPMSEKLIDWFRSCGAAVSTEIHDGGHELRNEEFRALAEFLTV